MMQQVARTTSYQSVYVQVLSTKRQCIFQLKIPYGGFHIKHPNPFPTLRKRLHLEGEEEKATMNK